MELFKNKNYSNAFFKSLFWNSSPTLLGFTFTVDTTLGTGLQEFSFAPSTFGSIDYLIDWGDNSTTNVYMSGNVNHVYSTGGQYDITITGEGITNYRFQDSPDSQKIINVKSWGPIQLTSAQVLFSNCSNLASFSSSDSPDLSICTNLASTFRDCTSFNSDLSNWDVITITNFFETFSNCFNFNQDLSSWDTSNADSLYRTFQNCTNFNGNVITWNTSNVTTIRQIFENCINFNQDLSSWDMSSVSTFYAAFYGASSFVGNGLANWDVSNVTDFTSSFRGCSNFNQNLSSWDMSNVTNLNQCFNGATSFFGDGVSSWDVPLLTHASNFLVNTSFTDSNYQNTLIGWTGWNGTTATKSLQSNVLIHFGTARYQIGGVSEDARNYLINTLGWTITDGGGI